jgi:drug/metabolite transporter (DMT)-like permease
MVLAALIVFTVLVWASAFPAIKIALLSYTPAELSCFRYLVASVVILLCTAGKIPPMPKRKDAPRFMASGLLGIALYSVALAYGETRVPAGVASMVVSTTPLFAAALAHVFLKDRLATRGWIGLLISLGGAFVLSASQSSLVPLDPTAAVILGAAVLQGMAIVVQKPLFSRYSASAVAAYTIWGATLAMAGFLPAVATAALKASFGATAAVVYLGAVPAALGILSWSCILSRIPAARAASLLYVVPVAALAVSWLWLGEVPAAVSIIGGALSIAGTLLAVKPRQGPAQQAVPMPPRVDAAVPATQHLGCANACRRMKADRSVKSVSNF